MFKQFLFCFFLILISNVYASNKDKIIENLQNTENLNFDFEQNINGKIEIGNNIKVHYVGTLEDGSEFDNSRSRETPIEFTVGSGQMIKGFDDACLGLELNGTKKFHIDPAQAYGDVNPEAVQVIPKNQFPEGFEFKLGAAIQGQAPNGLPFLAKVTAEDAQTVTLDFNHPLAGKTLHFEIEVIDIATPS